MIKLLADKNSVLIKGLNKPIKSEINVPGDKSISHRAVMLSSIANGNSIIFNLSVSRDNLATVAAFRKLGIRIETLEENKIKVHGNGLYGLEEPQNIINTYNSGTLTRLIAGILAGNDFFSVLSGDKYLNSRPMARIIDPLSLMGAKIFGRKNNYPPLSIIGSKLNPIYYDIPIPSAQVKSCLIFAGLYAGGNTIIYEKNKTRDHTERFLSLQDYPFTEEDTADGGNIINVKGGGELKPFNIEIPGDFSSAAFFIALGLLSKNSEITIKNVLLNDRRVGLINILKRMNANVEIIDYREDFEKVGTIKASYSKLSAINITEEDVPDMIDEFPIFAVIASFAEGVTAVHGAKELRVKETDRIKAIVANLNKFGVKSKEYDDGFEINGNPDYAEQLYKFDGLKLKTAYAADTDKSENLNKVDKLTDKKNNNGLHIKSYGDHRIAMSMIILALLLKNKETVINDVRCINTSFPDFFDILKKIIL
ncbi:MAG: 3-phosphoshikimate 1-carboxyvinyltransferase [bacterium]